MRRTRRELRRSAWVVPVLSLLASAGCAGAAPATSGAVSTAAAVAVDCERIAGDGRTFYESNPTYTDPRDHGAALPPSSPERQGMDPTRLRTGLSRLGNTPSLFSALVIRHKFGLLYLHDGKWAGRQVVPGSAVRASRTRTARVDEIFGYSEGWWMNTISGRETSFAWGHGGQFVYVLPGADLVFVTSENTNDDHTNEEIDPRAFVRDYLLPSITGP